MINLYLINDYVDIFLKISHLFEYNYFGQKM